MHQYRSFSPCFNANLAPRMNETNVTSGFGPVAIFKLSLECNQLSKYNKNQYI